MITKLKELRIEDETIIIFMTDNGPQQFRYNGNMKGRKGSVYNGGIRVPFFLKVPNKFKDVKVKEINKLSAHIDLVPTISELCDVELPKNKKIDGKSLIPLLEGKNTENRYLFSYWTRRFPEKYINMSIQNDEFKLVGNNNYDSAIEKFELYDLINDPNEKNNIIKENIPIALEFKYEMEKSLNELTKSKNILNPPRIIIGTKNENPTFLNRNDASGDRGIWAQNDIYTMWKVKFKKGTYNLKFKFKDSIKKSGTIFTEINNMVYSKKFNEPLDDVIEMKGIEIEDSNVDLISFLRVGNTKIYPFWIEINKKNEE